MFKSFTEFVNGAAYKWNESFSRRPRCLIYFNIHNRRANQHEWDESFRALYSAFWNDKEFAQVRAWIVSDQLYYANILPALKERNKT